LVKARKLLDISQDFTFPHMIFTDVNNHLSVACEAHLPNLTANGGYNIL